MDILLWKENHLIATQNDAISNNYIKTKIDKTQQNYKCWLCEEKDETIYHIVKRIQQTGVEGV